LLLPSVYMYPWNLYEEPSQFVSSCIVPVLVLKYVPLHDDSLMVIWLPLIASTTATCPALPPDQQTIAPSCAVWPLWYPSLVLPQNVSALFLLKVGFLPVIS